MLEDQSPETSSATEWINALGGLAGTIVGAVRGQPKTPRPVAPAKSATPAWLWPVVIVGAGVALLVLVVAIVRD